MRGGKFNYFVFSSDYKGFGEKVFRGFGDKIIFNSDSILVTYSKDTYSTDIIFRIYNFNTEEWYYNKISSGNIDEFFYDEIGSNQLVLFIPLSKYGIYKSSENLIVPYNDQIPIDFKYILDLNQNIWLFASDGLWRMNYTNLVEFNLE